MYAAELARIQRIERDLKRRLALAHRGAERWLAADRSFAWRAWHMEALRERMRVAIIASGKKAYAAGWRFKERPRSRTGVPGVTAGGTGAGQAQFAIGDAAFLPGPTDVGVAIPPEWLRWYDNTVQTALHNYTARVQREVSQITVRGAVDGTSMTDMTKQIRAMVTGMETWQAERIARTETMRLYNLGHYGRMETEGEELIGYEYSVVLDDRTSHICRPLAGVKVPRGGNVRVPPNHPHCRTILLAVHSYEEDVTDGVPDGGWSPHSIVDATPGFGAVPRMPPELQALARAS